MTTKTLSAALLLGLLTAATATAQESRVFRDDDVHRMRTWAIENATGGLGNDCLETLNENLKLLYNDRGMRLKSTVDLSMGVLQGLGRAAPTQVHDFFDERGRPTTGVTEPKTLRESVWESLEAFAGEERGYFGFGLSPLDGNHSVLLFLDNRDPENPNVYWVDQWSSKGGWKLYDTKEDLDGEIEKLTNSWWKSKLREKGVKFRSRCQLYPLIPSDPAEANAAVLTRTPRLRMRSGPGTDHAQVRDEAGNKRYFTQADGEYEILERDGAWGLLRLADGTEAWGHLGYMRTFYAAPPHAPVADEPAEEPEVVASGASGALDALD